MEITACTKFATFLFCEILSIGFLIPYLLEVYDDGFETDKWEHWLRIVSPVVSVPAIVTLGFAWKLESSRFLLASIVIYLCNIGLLLYTIHFGIAVSSFIVCYEYDDICLVQDDSCSGSNDDAWKGLMYLLGLSLYLTAVCLAFRQLVLREFGYTSAVGQSQTAPAEKGQDTDRDGQAKSMFGGNDLSNDNTRLDNPTADSAPKSKADQVTSFGFQESAKPQMATQRTGRNQPASGRPGQPQNKAQRRAANLPQIDTTTPPELREANRAEQAAQNRTRNPVGRRK